MKFFFHSLLPFPLLASYHIQLDRQLNWVLHILLKLVFCRLSKEEKVENEQKKIQQKRNLKLSPDGVERQFARATLKRAVLKRRRKNFCIISEEEAWNIMQNIHHSDEKKVTDRDDDNKKAGAASLNAAEDVDDGDGKIHWNLLQFKFFRLYNRTRLLNANGLLLLPRCRLRWNVTPLSRFQIKSYWAGRFNFNDDENEVGSCGMIYKKLCSYGDCSRIFNKKAFFSIRN